MGVAIHERRHDDVRTRDGRLFEVDDPPICDVEPPLDRLEIAAPQDGPFQLHSR
jgi:hypothetical protein